MNVAHGSKRWWSLVVGGGLAGLLALVGAGFFGAGTHPVSTAYAGTHPNEGWVNGDQSGSLIGLDPEGKFIRDVVRLAIKPIWNAYNFFVMYANADEIKAGSDVSDVAAAKKALDVGNVDLALIWVHPQDEPEIRRAFLEAAEALGVTLDARAASAVFAALATDTGWFRFGSTTPNTWRNSVPN